MSLVGVESAISKHSQEAEYKGVKAHFRMDESGILHLEKVAFRVCSSCADKMGVALIYPYRLTGCKASSHLLTYLLQTCPD